MGFDDGRIILDCASGAYYPGQTLYGRIEFDQNKFETFRGIYVEIKGFCDVEWTTNHSRQENDQTEEYTVKHSSYEQYFFRSIYLAGGKSGDLQLHPGHYSYGFECQIPADCPSSFEGSNGHVRYQITAVVDQAFKADQRKLASFRIIAPLDLNTCSFARDPIEIEMHNSFCCWCMSAGSAETLVKVPVSGFCPGQVIPIEASCNNQGNVDIVNITFAIVKHLKYRATNEPDIREESDTIVSVSKGPVAEGNTRNWSLEMKVPTMDVPNLNKCNYINITYTFKVSISVSGCHQGSEERHPIVIGTIPLVGVQDNIPNLLPDRMPQQQFADIQNQPNVYPPPPITTQPITNYPSVHTYPLPYSETAPQNPAYLHPAMNPSMSPYPQPGVNPHYPSNHPTPYPPPQSYPHPSPHVTVTALKTGPSAFGAQTSPPPYAPGTGNQFQPPSAPKL